MNVFEAVKQSVTTRQAAEHYGIRVNRNGMACCPFHNDKTPSMKLDKRFHCFGCGADGDVIDFVAALYGLGKKEAAAQLASDFGLAYEDWKPPGRARKPKPRQKSPEEQFREAKAHCFRVLADYLHLLRVWKTDYAPHSPEEAFHPRFVEALQKQAHVEYLLDVLLFGDTEEIASLITEHGKDVIQVGMGESQTVKTMIHEVAHAMLHNSDFMKKNGEEKDRLTKETEAESIAFTVCSALGIDTSDYSFPYIADEITEEQYRAELLDYEEAHRKLNEQLTTIMEDTLAWERALSLRNPWIQQMAQYKTPEELDRNFVKKYIEQVTVTLLENGQAKISLTMKTDEWKKMLGRIEMEGTDDGTKE